MKKQFRDFESARDFVRKLGLQSQREWYEYAKSGDKPDDIPSTPQTVYKNKGWKNWGNFLGTGTVAPQLQQHSSFHKAREFVRTLCLQSVQEWYQYCKSGDKPDDIPRNVSFVYKNKGWITWGDWLGTGRIADKDKIFLPYSEAQEFVRALKLKSQTEWTKYCKSGNKPKEIPNAPALTYKNKGWTTWGEWFGTGTVATQDRKYRSYKEAREFVRALKLKGNNEWREYCKSGNKPDDIPSNPWDVYKEWKKK
ncbi:hypothetical protein OAJ02_02320 [Nitrosopumilus sp.]|nr:hypothetical protein [Nitrosopumilus sp.]